MRRNQVLRLLSLLVIGLCTTCAETRTEQVVVYVSVDQHHAEPVLDDFQQRTGIMVRALYDVEAAKTTGLVNRLVAEAGNPQADVFWNGEFSQTISLKTQGILSDGIVSAGIPIPDHLKDPDGYWAGTCGRARVLIINTERLSPAEYPSRVADLLDERWPANQVGIARPLFGTSLTHAAALYAVLGPEAAQGFFKALRQRGVRVVDGNSVVRDLVERGDLMWGLTDTDDAAAALERGAPVAVILPDQEEGGIGTLVTPTTVALIKGAPHPGNGLILGEFLLSVDAEAQLVESGWCQIPVYTVNQAAGGLATGPVIQIKASPDHIHQMLKTASADLRGIFLE